MADPIRCVYAMEDGYFCTKHSNGFYDASCRLLEGKPCEDQKPPKPVTNYDRLISKSPEELAEFIGCDPMHDICPNNCHEDPERPCTVCILEWLKREAEDG